MRYGNCFLGAFFLRIKYHRKNARFIYRYRPNTWVPHLMVQTNDAIHHYRVKKDLLPWPFCYLVFEGQFETVNTTRDFHKPRRFKTLKIKPESS